jgi:flagellar motility protein MotE (MotC chaperone)
MLRRAIRCLAPAGPAWTTFKSLVDQGAIPDVDAGKAEAVFATLSSDQLKQLADAAAKLKHKSRCAEQKLTTELSNIKLAVAAVTAALESTRPELERRLAELAAREKSLRDRLLTLDDTIPTLVWARDAATRELEEITEALNSGGLNTQEAQGIEQQRCDAEALVDERDAEVERATALREHLADVAAVSEGLRTVLTTLLAHLDEKLEAANSIAAATAVTAKPATGS